jgi:hypothetical protein
MDGRSAAAAHRIQSFRGDPNLPKKSTNGGADRRPHARRFLFHEGRSTRENGPRAQFLFAGIRGERAVPTERTRERNKASQRRKEQPGLDNRHRDSDGQIREKGGDTRIDSLRQIYGDSFAPGIRGDAHLKTLLERTGSNSLSDYLKTTAQSSVGPQDREERVNEKSSGIRYASDARFREAHGKTSALHASLFRRLAE